MAENMASRYDSDAIVETSRRDKKILNGLLYLTRHLENNLRKYALTDGSLLGK